MNCNICNKLKNLSFNTWDRIGFTWSSPFLRISETTITENLLFNLAQYHDRCMHSTIYLFEAIDENSNGNDIEIIIQTDRGFIKFPTQAKILYKNTLKYEVINHKYLSGRYQIDNLIAYASTIGGIPMYLFYNYIPYTNQRMRHYGCTMIDANYIKNHFSPHRTTTTTRWRIPTFNDLHPHALPWHWFLCNVLGQQGRGVPRVFENIDNDFFNEYDITLYNLNEILDDDGWSEIQPIGNIITRQTRISNDNGFNPRYRIIVSQNMEV